ncbi:hypothetical protein [Fulvivirga sediminis]|uniref:Uncharacterized protein n=1 Tax=Fulvivirga sediminis TaxID=2803949 RepID=A0A937JZM4_9BACT|nr:hypothetical protein [Fulvivirga sediminis]MBL3654567.1 hypothetical protein [Fulvivirga sediminis]
MRKVISNKLSFNISATRTLRSINSLVLFLSLATAYYIDIISALGIATSSFYVIAFIAIKDSESLVLPFLIALLISLFIVIGPFLSPVKLGIHSVFFNLSLTIIISWMMASLFHFKKIRKLKMNEIDQTLKSESKHIPEEPQNEVSI